MMDIQNKSWEEIEALFQELFKGINKKLGLITNHVKFKSCVQGDVLSWGHIPEQLDEPGQFLPLDFIRGLAKGYISAEPNYDDLIQKGFVHNGQKYKVVSDKEN